jgi:hypothetical protein
MTLFVLTVIATAVYGSFFEWTLHRFFMHRPVGKFVYAFNAHAIVHHGTFKYDHTYHLQDEKDKATIPMAWWNKYAIVAIASLPAFFISWHYHRWWIWFWSAATVGAYYGVYEYIHWCMHLPKKRVIERSGIFFRLNGHHLLHHRYMNRNFNVVFPLADLCCRTLMRRSPIKFAQPRGVFIPDVQPKVHWPKLSVTR